MLFPEHIPDSDYDVINPIATISKATTWKIPAAEMTSSQVYSKYPAKRKEPSVRQKAPLGSDSHTSQWRSVTRRVDDRPVTHWGDERPVTRRFDEGPVTRRFDDGPVTRRFDEGRVTRRFDEGPVTRRFDKGPVTRRFDAGPVTRRFDEEPMTRRFDARPVTHTAAPTTDKPHLTVLPSFMSAAVDIYDQSQVPRMRSDYTTKAVQKDTWEHLSSRHGDKSLSDKSHVAVANSANSRENQRHFRHSAVSSSPSRQNRFQTFDEIPRDIRRLNSEELASCLRLLKVPEACVDAFIEMKVDGELLTSIDESILTDEFHFRKFDAIKVMKFAMEGYRPNFL